jgi:hypothetical protein
MQKLSATVNGLKLSDMLPTPRIMENRKYITRLMNKIISLGEPMPDCKLKHIFSPGIYVREVTMPAGSLIVGRIHTTEHLNEVISGECQIFTADDELVTRRGGDIFTSKAGVQKVGWCITDVVWRTIHATNETNIEKIEQELSVLTYDELENDQLILERKRIGI